MKPRTYNEVVYSLPVVEVSYYQDAWKGFEKSRLGRVRAMIPIKEIVQSIAKKMPKRKSNCGRKENMPLESQVLLLFLRSYFSMSDEKLLELLNGSLFVQMFCDIIIDPSDPIKDTKYISAVRNRIAPYIDFNDIQKYMADAWKPYLENLDTCLMDATCYESNLRFPTDVKLLWECNDWLHTFIKRICDKKHLNSCMPINQFSKVRKSYKAYSKIRKKTYKKTRQQINKNIHLLEKQIAQCEEILDQYSDRLTLTSEEKKRFKNVKVVLEQQKEMFNGNKIKDRVVSIDREYIRPIVRGKENKPTEFGSKAHLIQVDGISFIQKLSFGAFNECKLLEDSVAFHEFLFGEKVTKLGADAIYPTADNRNFCTKNHIVTNFVRKGPKPAVDATRVIRKAIAKERATSMEGCFGNQKEHFDIKRVRARNQASEELQILFAVMMSNACIIADREERKRALLENKEKEKKRARA